MKVADFDFYLPEELIAQDPINPRDASRLLVVNRSSQQLFHKHFYEIVDFFDPGDLLVLNQTKVLPARLFGTKSTGAKVELVLLKRIKNDAWECLVKPGKKLKPGAKIFFGAGELSAEVADYTSSGGRIIDFTYQGIFEEVLDRLGQMPLPPYIHKELKEKNRYQTVYAKEQGSAAAPTAGLHFTNSLLNKLTEKGVNTTFLTLHVGLGTFRPVKTEKVQDHEMHSEYFSISKDTAEIINKTKLRGNKIIAVGTTSVRTLESAADSKGKVLPQDGWTDIFIYPGFEFKVVDSIITNFHLPKSSLLMLVSAFAGTEIIKKAYQIAIDEEYRFFSFGDAMFLTD